MKNIPLEYTRAEAIGSGRLVDVTHVAKEVGVPYPVAVSNYVWRLFVVPPKNEHDRVHDENLRDLLSICHHWWDPQAVGASWTFKVLLRTKSFQPLAVPLCIVLGLGDEGEPVVTIRHYLEADPQVPNHR